MADDKEIKRLRQLLDEELRKDKLEAALRSYAELERLEPKASRWPHKRGDLLRRMGRIKEAVGAYDRAVGCYVDEGFVARAVAMAKTVLILEPSRIDVLERVDPAAARALQARPNAGHAAVLPESAPPPPTHSAVLPESAPPLARPNVDVESAPPLARPNVDVAAPAPRPAPPLPRPPRRPKFSSRTMAAVQLPPLEEPSQASTTSAATIATAKKGPPPLPKPRTSIRPAAALRPQRQPTPFDDEALLANAPDLVRAPDAAANEVRFSDLPPRPRMSAPVTIVEMQTRHTLPPGVDVPSRTATPGDLARMPLFPLFSDLPKDAFTELVQTSALVEMTHGKYVIRRGDPSDCMYGIVEGSVQIQPPGLPPELFIPLSEGDVFGESCLLRDEPRHADVVVQGKLTALRMSKVAIDALVRKHRTVAEVILELLTRRLLGNLLNSSHLFSDLDPQTRTELASMFEVRRAANNIALMESGKRSDGLYIVLTGRVSCLLPGATEPIEAGPGSMFGHASLIGTAPSEVSAKTLVNMIVLRLPAARFSRIAMQYSSLLARISELPALADVSL